MATSATKDSSDEESNLCNTIPRFNPQNQHRASREHEQLLKTFDNPFISQTIKPHTKFHSEVKQNQTTYISHDTTKMVFNQFLIWFHKTIRLGAVQSMDTLNTNLLQKIGISTQPATDTNPSDVIKLWRKDAYNDLQSTDEDLNMIINPEKNKDQTINAFKLLRINAYHLFRIKIKDFLKGKSKTAITTLYIKATNQYTTPQTLYSDANRLAITKIIDEISQSLQPDIAVYSVAEMVASFDRPVGSSLIQFIPVFISEIDSLAERGLTLSPDQKATYLRTFITENEINGEKQKLNEYFRTNPSRINPRLSNPQKLLKPYDIKCLTFPQLHHLIENKHIDTTYTQNDKIARYAKVPVVPRSIYDRAIKNLRANRKSDRSENYTSSPNSNSHHRRNYDRNDHRQHDRYRDPNRNSTLRTDNSYSNRNDNSNRNRYTDHKRTSDAKPYEQNKKRHKFVQIKRVDRKNYQECQICIRAGLPRNHPILGNVCKHLTANTEACTEAYRKTQFQRITNLRPHPNHRPRDDNRRDNHRNDYSNSNSNRNNNFSNPKDTNNQRNSVTFQTSTRNSNNNNRREYSNANMNTDKEIGVYYEPNSKQGTIVFLPKNADWEYLPSIPQPKDDKGRPRGCNFCYQFPRNDTNPNAKNHPPFKCIYKCGQPLYFIPTTAEMKIKRTELLKTTQSSKMSTYASKQWNPTWSNQETYSDYGYANSIPPAQPPDSKLKTSEQPPK